ncbi:MAG: ABC transporter substrate-binding protein [Oscillospiraceae bacterium]|nr:ABC transporter substrate-binding protein [Oscillospiraceae bacterium]
MNPRFFPFLALLLAVSLTACVSVPPPAPPVPAPARVAALKGPTGLGMLKMISDAPERFAFSIHGSADEIVAGLQGGTLDIAAVPCNLAAVLYNRMEGGVRVIAVNTRGVLYVLDTTGSVHTVEDLRGRTVYSTGMGTTPEFALNYILRQNGLEPGRDVQIEYKAEATELGTLMASGIAELCVLPEPYVTTVLSRNESARAALSLSAEWDAVQAEFGMLTGSVVARTAFLEEHPDVVTAFLTDYRASVDFINAHIEEGARLSEVYEIAPAAIARDAIPRCNIIFLDGAEMERNLRGYLGVLFEADPKSVGGSLPDAAFYYIPA